MWKNSKVRIYILILLLIFPKLLFANSLDKTESILSSKNYYDLLVPKNINISIIGNEYIKFLKQIRDVGEKQNLNSNLINFQKKKWIEAIIKSDQIHDKPTNVEIILHGDFNDHISLPYSSFRVKTDKNFFYQLRNFIFFRPNTRRYEAEIFGTLLLKNIGILSPYSRYVTLTINDNPPNDYIFQEKITKYFVERNGFRDGPILEYDEKNKWNNYILQESFNQSANFYKLENGSYANNEENFEKIFLAATLKQFQSKIRNSSNNLFETFMLVMGGCHGFAAHNRKYYFDILNYEFLPIYYDGMLFYDKSQNLCEAERKKYEIRATNKNFKNLEKILKNDLFKRNLKKEYFELVNNKKSFDRFDYFWNYMEKNLINYKKLIKTNEILEEDSENIIKKDIFFIDKLKSLKLSYPTIYFYKDIKKQSYNICYNWFNLNENVHLVYSKEKIFKKDQGCKKIKKTYVKKLLKNEIYFKTNINEKIRIFPILIGNVSGDELLVESQNLKVERININNDIITKEINLKSNVILRLSVSKNVKIKNLIINSSPDNDSAMVLYLNKNVIENLEFNQINKLDQIHNKNIENKNITGCVTILDSNFTIDQIKINGSNCEDGLNIIRSTGVINKIDVVDAISDGVDFDYSNINVKNSHFLNIKGDCVDLSFGNYKFENAKINGCGDKGISVGENSILNLQSSTIFNSSIGIASKDSSKVNASDILIKSTKNCLSAYNKKSEFGGGYIEYKNMKCVDSVQSINVDNLSEIKNMDNSKSN